MPSSRHLQQSAAPTPEAVRVDKWLWAARFYKTRSLATQAIDAGHVRVNGQRSKPARELHRGDLVHITRGSLEIEFKVEALSAVRGPAPVARTLYAETEESIARRAAAAELRRLAPVAAPHGGRPTKRDRRRIEQFRGDD
ncbi:RNA-binding S4 domain-containing protein [Pseudazoarcus pumilus]|uniref:RNA-binding protein n=1 Tax=Pseudazoarcus pumilus TaxID=2067960 RepID=A0A2I6S435_9RHOO|nr:RNA-binding S4 domain-containing protein [Pseudazoarcus pumilus]AUN94026.1 RNA-binding protein [Pseudazoarcus pumilus]